LPDVTIDKKVWENIVRYIILATAATYNSLCYSLTNENGTVKIRLTVRPMVNIKGFSYDLCMRPTCLTTKGGQQKNFCIQYSETTIKHVI